MDIEELLTAYVDGKRDFRKETITANEPIHDKNLQDINLAAANLKGLTFVNCDFSGANLEGAILSQTTLRGVKLCRANLVKTKFLGAQFTDVDLTDALYDPQETQFPRQFNPQQYGAKPLLQKVDEPSSASVKNEELKCEDSQGRIGRIDSVNTLLTGYNQNPYQQLETLKNIAIPVVESLTTQVLANTGEIIFLEEPTNPSYWIVTDQQGYSWLVPSKPYQYPLDQRLFQKSPPKTKEQRTGNLLAPPRVRKREQDWVLVELGVVVDSNFSSTSSQLSTEDKPSQNGLQSRKLDVLPLLAMIVILGLVAVIAGQFSRYTQDYSDGSSDSSNNQQEITTSTDTASPTQTPSSSETEMTPSSSETEIASTSTPTVSDPEPVRPEPLPDPSAFVENYYALINSGDYNAAWYRLTSSLQNDPSRHPNGYSSYIDWWTKVQYIDVYSTQVLSLSADRAVVDASIQYIMTSGKSVYQTVRFTLVNAGGEWLIQMTQRL